MIRDPSDGSVKQQPIGYSALKAKHGETWGLKPVEPLKPKPSRAPTADELREHYAKHGLGFTVKQTAIDGE